MYRSGGIVPIDGGVGRTGDNLRRRSTASWAMLHRSTQTSHLLLNHVRALSHPSIPACCSVCTVQYGETGYISGWTASFSALKSKAISRRISLVCAKQCWNQLVARKEGCQRYRNVFLNSLSWRHCVNIHVLFFTKVNTAKYQAGNWDYRGHRIRFLKPYESNDGFVRDLACSYIDWWTKFCFENVHHILSKLKQDCSSELMGNQITLFTSIFRCCWNVFTYR